MADYNGERVYSSLTIIVWLILQLTGFVSSFCPLGKYLTASMVCRDCEFGYYCDSTGIKPCPIGTKCSEVGMAASTPCKNGTFQSLTAQVYCIECPIGRYCPTEGLTEGILCPAGSKCYTSFNMLESPSATTRHSDNLPSNQFSQFAVDDQPECSRTNTVRNPDKLDVPAYWRIEKNEDQTWLQSVFFETETESLHHFSGFKILVEVDPNFSLYETDLSKPGASSTVCYEHENSPPESISKSITCDPPLVGNRFVIWHSTTTTQLVLCKVEMIGVSGGTNPYPCAKGEYQPNVGQSSCLRCDSGYYCNQTGLEAQEICPAGSMCPNSAESPTACPGGTYQSETGQVECLSCMAGYYCESGAIMPVICPVNHYCPGAGNAYPVPCSQDTFADTGQEACSSSLDGYYTNNGQQTICPAGHFCINGVLAKCSVGTFVAQSGSAACDPCTAGYYCETEGLQSVTGICWLGHFCAEGASIPTPCSDGYYQAAEGKPTCDICPIGYYCNQTMAENAKQSGADKPTHGVVIPTKCPVNMCLEPGSTDLTYTCTYDPFESGNLALDISCTPSCMKRMTSMSDLKFIVTCANCEDWVPTYQWSLRECFNENIMECVHCSDDNMFRPSTGDFTKIIHSNTAGWAYYAVVVKVTLQNPSKDEGMTSFIYQYYDNTKVVCEVSPITGQAMTTPFTITCNEPTLPEVLPYTCKVSYALEKYGENIIYQRKDTCNHDGISLHQGEKEQDYRLHLLVAGTYLDHLLWQAPLLLTVEPTPVTNEELGNTVDDLSGNLTESATEEEVIEILNDLQSVSITLNTKPPDANITFSNYSATEKEEMAKEENKKVREAVLNTISTINTSSIEIMISVTSTLNQVTLKKDELSTEAKDQAFDMYNTFTEDLKEKEETTSDEDVRKAAGSLLFGIGSVLDMTSDSYIEDDDAIKVTTAAPITKEESKKLVIKKTQQLLDSVETISTIVFKRQDVDSEPAVFESPVMSVAIAKVSPKNLVGKPIKAGDDGDDSRTSMVLPEDMDLSETSDATGGDDSIRTEFLLLKKNPFVWGKNAKHIKAPVVSFELKNSKNDILHVKNLATPIKVQLPHDGGDLAGTIPFLCTLQKVNETIQLNATEYRPCAATFELTIDPRKATVFSLSLPDHFTVLLSISLTKKFDRLRLSENGTGFRYPTDTHIISKFYSHLSEIEADIFHNAMQYCKACSEICCDTTDICTGIYGHCMYYCKTVLQNPFTENCTGIIDLTVYCDSCQSVCCDGTENCINILENCVFMCAVHLKEKMTTDCKTSLSESYTRAMDSSLQIYCQDCDFFCCESLDSESCSDIYANCIYFCSHFEPEVMTSCAERNKPGEPVVFLPTTGNQPYKMYFGLSVSTTDQQVLNYFKERDPICVGNISSTACTADVDIQIPLNVSAMGCDYWDSEKESWSTYGMQISSESNGNTLLCTSNHLTAFSKTVIVAPTFIDPLDVQLFTTFFDNPVIVTVVIVVWMIYFFLVHWSRQKDKSDEEQVGVIYCVDNVITDTYTYVICISTGWWKQAGTTANVYIYIKGSVGISPRKSLKTPVRKCFQTGFEDWFLITTERSLGDIKSVTLWHDNSGLSPHWFVNQIFVKDVHTDSSWTFVYNDWLAVDRGNLLLTTTTLLPVTEEELKLKKKFNFMITSAQNLRDGHIWISIFYKQASNTFTRVQRLTCCLTLLLTTMLTNLMFYGIPTDDPEDQLVTGGFKLSLSQIVIGIESSLIMFPVNLLIVQLFTKVKQKPATGRTPHPIEFYLEACLGRRWEKIMNNMFLQFKTLTNTRHPGKEHFIPRQRPDERRVLEAINTEIETRQTGKIFPWWFVYVAWSVSITTCITSSYFVALYGLKYGYDRSIEWLVSFLTGFFQSIFVQQPVKVLGIACILTLVFKKTVSFGESVPGRKRDADEEYVQSVYIKPPEAHQIIMEPLPKRLLDNIKERLRVEWLMNTTIRDVIFHMFYVSVVITMVHGHRNIYSSFLCTEAVRSLFVKPSIGMKMGKVSNTDDFEKYLHSTFIPAMTDITSDHDYATRGSNHYLVGTYRLRQLRIKTDVCAPIMYGLPHDCKGPYSVTEEETRYFDQSWSKPLTGVDATSVDDKSDHWKYRSTWDLKTLPFPGTHGTYSGGGYVLQLPAKVSTHSDILSGLFADKWIDQYTRAIFIEFTLYNPNVDLFTVVVYLFEFTNVGRVFPINYEFTSSLYHYSTDYQMVVLVCEILFICFTCLFIYVEVKRFKQLGKVKYFSDFWSYVEISQLSLSVSLLGLFIKRFFTINNTLAELKQAQDNGYINFHSAIFWDFVFGYVSAVLVALVTLKTLKHVRYNKRIKIVTKTLSNIRPVYIGYVFGFAVMTTSFASLGYSFFGYSMDGYKTFYDSWVSIILVLLGVGDFVGLQDMFRYAGPMFIVAIVMICQYILMVMMTTVLNFGRLEAKHELSKRKRKMALIKYMRSRVKLLLDMK